ncbi:MAG: sodium-dependent transporter [Gammaproteobacteria bacterium]|nr:sodium-dependent transporter [Gammaproteobacteria bacterium]
MAMAGGRESQHGEWSSRWVFIMAATGSAVGLGNIWRFPYVTGENGGGAFVLLYLLCIALVGVPIMMAEVMIGRRGRQSPMNTMKTLAHDEELSPNWRWLGGAGMLAGFLILSFYSVVAGWSLAYVFYVGGGVFNDATVAVSQNEFAALTGSAERLLAWHTLFMVMAVAVVARGVQHGLEKAVKGLMPALFVLLLVMVGYAMGNGDFKGAIDYLFTPDFSKLDADAVLAAMGQAFFSLSLGMGAIMTYGAYLPRSESIPSTSIIIALADTAVAILAGLAIFPIVFGYGLEAGSGPGLVFVTLTIAFGQMPGGQIFGCLFFMLLTVAAWTSAISLLEPVTAWLVELRCWSRRRAATVAGLTAWLFGIGSLLSFNVLADFKLADRTFFDWTEFFSTTIMLPLGGLFIAIFAGWRLTRESTIDELDIGSGFRHHIWLNLVRWLAPAGVLVVFLNALEII